MELVLDPVEENGSIHPVQLSQRTSEITTPFTRSQRRSPMEIEMQIEMAQKRCENQLFSLSGGCQT